VQCGSVTVQCGSVRVQCGSARVQCGSVRVQCGSVGGCSVAPLVARWLAVRQARVRISARHPMEVTPTEPTAVKIWRWAAANVYE
jgi:hypothetical protein